MNSQTALIALKLNADDIEDRRLLRTVMWLSYLTTRGEESDYHQCRTYVALLVNFKLKDEWEKAKQEAAGPLKWAYLKLKQRRNLHKRPGIIQRSVQPHILRMTAKSMKSEELFVEVGDP